MTRHPDDETLSRFLDGDLPEWELAELERAAAAEPRLTARLARLRRADAAAGAWFDSALADPPADQVEAIRAGFRRRAGGSPAASRRWLAPAAAAAAVLVIGMFALDNAIERRVADAVAEMRRERASDMALLGNAVQEVLETRESGTEVRFRNTETGTTLAVLPQRTWRSESGHWCREFVEMIGSAGAEQAPVSTACRDADGTWRRVRTELRNPAGPVWPAAPISTDL